MTSWFELPNAPAIKRILDSLEKNPYTWDRHRGFDPTLPEFQLARTRAVDINRVNEYCDATTSAFQAFNSTWSKAVNAVMALVAWDDCGYMLDSEPGELAILAKFGDPKAKLLLTACIILSKDYGE